MSDCTYPSNTLEIVLVRFTESIVSEYETSLTSLQVSTGNRELEIVSRTPDHSSPLASRWNVWLARLMEDMRSQGLTKDDRWGGRGGTLASRPGVRLLTERLVKILCRTRFAESGLILTARPHTGREYYYGNIPRNDLFSTIGYCNIHEWMWASLPVRLIIGPRNSWTN